MLHPFLDPAFQVRWSTLDPHAIPVDISSALATAEVKLAEVADQDRGRWSFESVVLAYEEATRALNEAWGLVSHLDAVCNSPTLRDAHKAMLPQVSAFFAKIPLDENLWDTFLTYSKTDEAKALTPVKRRALEETLATFREHGAELSPEKKKRLKELEAELSEATQKYSENVLDSTNAWELILDDVAALQGLPASALEAAQADAAAKGLGTDEAPKYRITLKGPSIIPVMEHVEDANIRKLAWEGSGSIGRTGAYDNSELVRKILKLRDEKAKLLGKANFADHILARRMVKNGQNAVHFVESLHDKVKPAFHREVIALQEYVADKLHQMPRLLEPWEITYWSEKRRKEEFGYDEEDVRPYFAVSGVLNGMFRLAELLFDLKITERGTVFYEVGKSGISSSQPTEEGPVEVWHPEVKFYELRTSEGILLGSFYADWHPRDSKRGGAWMNYLKGGVPPTSDRDRRPHLGLICGNMTPPLGDRDALLSHDEVCTVFHEFGHLLHQLLGNVEVASLNGVNVAWDFVELPSQLMENFCWSRESLDFFAKHHETGEKLPEALYKKMVASRNYMSAAAFMRQLSLGKLDLELHINYATDEQADLDVLTRTVLKDYLFPTQTEAPTMARRFGHLFSSSVGYAAGYYSYKWAEVLDADAFTRFESEGVLNPQVGRAFRDAILSRGDSDDPAKLFREFMGRDPDPEALLKRADLL